MGHRRYVELLHEVVEDAHENDAELVLGVVVEAEHVLVNQPLVLYSYHVDVLSVRRFGHFGILRMYNMTSL